MPGVLILKTLEALRLTLIFFCKNSLILSILIIIFCSPAYAAIIPPKIISKCQKCHGQDFSGKRKNPSILNLKYSVIYDSLTTKVPKKMKRTVNKLSEQQKKDIAEYIFFLKRPISYRENR